jgi:hypothetical protein
MSPSLALTLCLALTAAGSAAALSPLFACADLPANWGNDSDENDNNNDNGPWVRTKGTQQRHTTALVWTLAGAESHIRAMLAQHCCDVLPHMVSTPTLQADLSADPSSAVYAQIYSTFESRYSNAPLNAAWTPCTTPEPSAVGCQQTAGQGMNYALQVSCAFFPPRRPCNIEQMQPPWAQTGPP